MLHVQEIGAIIIVIYTFPLISLISPDTCSQTALQSTRVGKLLSYLQPFPQKGSQAQDSGFTHS